MALHVVGRNFYTKQNNNSKFGKKTVLVTGAPHTKGLQVVNCAMFAIGELPHILFFMRTPLFSARAGKEMEIATNKLTTVFLKYIGILILRLSVLMK